MNNLFRIVKLVICIGLITVFAGCAATNKRTSTGQYVDDSVITTKVKAAILNESSLKVSQINVETYKGVVQLSGFVDVQENAKTAEKVTKGVDGVVSVENDLKVK